MQVSDLVQVYLLSFSFWVYLFLSIYYNVLCVHILHSVKLCLVSWSHIGGPSTFQSYNNNNVTPKQNVVLCLFSSQTLFFYSKDPFEVIDGVSVSFQIIPRQDCIKPQSNSGLFSNWLINIQRKTKDIELQILLKRKHKTREKMNRDIGAKIKKQYHLYNFN